MRGVRAASSDSARSSSHSSTIRTAAHVLSSAASSLVARPVVQQGPRSCRSRAERDRGTTPAMTDHRARARELAAQAVQDGEPTRWSEELYALAERGDVTVPWADLEPNPALVRVLPSLPVAGARTLVVGRGYGYDPILLAGSRAHVTAFDVAPSAVSRCRERFPA